MRGGGSHDRGVDSALNVAPALEGGINVSLRDSCLDPALLDVEAFHIFLWGQKYLSDEQVAHHYLLDLQIPNMKIIIYRRVRLQKPARR